MNEDKCIGFWVKNIPYIWKKNKRIYIVDKETYKDGLKINGKRYFFETFSITDDPKIMNLFRIKKSFENKDVRFLRVNGNPVRIPMKYIHIKNLVPKLKDFLLINKTKNINALERLYKQDVLSIKIPSPQATITKKEESLKIKGLFNFIYLIYLSKKYKNLCVTFGDIGKSKYVSNLIRRGGITVVLETKTSVPKIIYNNTEHLFSLCLESKRRFIFIPVSIYYKYSDSRHANFLLFDTKKKQIEIYDPWGEAKIENIQGFIRDNVIEKFKIRDWQVLESGDFCPKKAFQRLEAVEGEGEGYCAVWRLWLLELRLQNEDKNLENLIKKSLLYINEKHWDFEVFISKYYNYVVQESSKILKKFKIKPIRKLSATDKSKIMKFILAK